MPAKEKDGYIYEQELNVCKTFYFGKVSVVGHGIQKLRVRCHNHLFPISLGIAVLALCLPLTVWAIGVPTLVQDFTPIPYQSGFDMPTTWPSLNWPNTNDPYMMTSANGLLFFVGWDERNGAELWKSDGTANGTVLLKDIYPGASDSIPTEFTPANGTLFFAADDGSTGQELWKTDGTLIGTVQVKDILPGPQRASLRNLTVVNGILFFSVDNGTAGSEVWKSDGTEAGTVLVKAGFPLLSYGYEQNLSDFTAVNERLFFTAQDGNTGNELWTSDGTESGTMLVKDINSGVQGILPSNLTGLNGILFFTIYTAAGQELWKSDGTADGTVLVQNFGENFVTSLISSNRDLFFVRTNDTSDSASLWKSDGTAIGTELVREFIEGRLEHLLFINSTLFFYLNDSSALPVQKHSLWKSDGTMAGTVMVRELGRYIGTSINVNGFLFFTNGSDLWKSDGTTTGTILVFIGYTRVIKNLTGGNDKVFFHVCNGSECILGQFSDNGYTDVKSPVPAQGSSALKQLTVKNRELFFVKDIGYDSYEGSEIWRSNGTTAGSERIRAFAYLPSSASSHFVIMNRELFFSAADDQYRQLWRSDGTAEGTTVLKDSEATALANVNGMLFFATHLSDPASVEMWKSNGTASGTVQIKQIHCTDEPRCYMWISHITDAQHNAFFSIEIDPLCCHNSRKSFIELWNTDGTEQGTVLMKRFGMTFWNSTPATLTELTFVNDMLFFSARETGVVNALWRSDGTPEGTIALTPSGATADDAPAELTDVDGVLFFRINDGIHGAELWKSDGSLAGTVMVKDILPGPFGATPTELTAVNGKLFFSAHDGNSGRELWQSDGTAEGTMLVKDIISGFRGAVPQQLTNVNDTLVFSASDEQHGVEAWRSDGTEAGTTLIQDIAPGLANANPTQFIFAGDQLFFTANDGLAGQELWSLRSFADNLAIGGGEVISWLDHTVYQFPSGTFPIPVTVTHTLHDPTEFSAGDPLLLPIRAFELKVVDSETGTPVQPGQPYHLTAQYTDAELGVVLASTLALYYWDGQQWVKETSSTVNVTNHYVAATPMRDALWLVGGKTERLFLPLIGK